jgi:hypothetical protein
MTVHGPALACHVAQAPFIARRLLTSLAGVLSAPVTAKAQQTRKVPRIGVLARPSAARRRLSPVRMGRDRPARIRLDAGIRCRHRLALRREKDRVLAGTGHRAS